MRLAWKRLTRFKNVKPRCARSTMAVKKITKDTFTGEPWPRNERLFRGVTLKTWSPYLGGKNYLWKFGKGWSTGGKNVSLKLGCAVRTFVLDRTQAPLLKFYSYSLINSSITVREELPLLNRRVPRVSNDFFPSIKASTISTTISTSSFRPVFRQTWNYRSAIFEESITIYDEQSCLTGPTETTRDGVESDSGLRMI